MAIRLVLSVAVIAGLVACAPTDADQNRTVRAPAAAVVGEAENCIGIQQIRNTRVWDDYTIDFETTGGKAYRNTLPNRCPSLGFEERFAYQTSLSQLCSTDIITVLDSDGRRGASCGLGAFVPVEVAPK